MDHQILSKSSYFGKVNIISNQDRAGGQYLMKGTGISLCTYMLDFIRWSEQVLHGAHALKMSHLCEF